LLLHRHVSDRLAGLSVDFSVEAELMVRNGEWTDVVHVRQQPDILNGILPDFLEHELVGNGRQNPYVDKKQEDFLGNESPLRKARYKPGRAESTGNSGSSVKSGTLLPKEDYLILDIGLRKEDCYAVDRNRSKISSRKAHP